MEYKHQTVFYENQDVIVNFSVCIFHLATIIVLTWNALFIDKHTASSTLHCETKVSCHSRKSLASKEFLENITHQGKKGLINLYLFIYLCYLLGFQAQQHLQGHTVTSSFY